MLVMDSGRILVRTGMKEKIAARDMNCQHMIRILLWSWQLIHTYLSEFINTFINCLELLLLCMELSEHKTIKWYNVRISPTCRRSRSKARWGCRCWVCSSEPGARPPSSGAKSWDRQPHPSLRPPDSWLQALADFKTWKNLLRSFFVSLPVRWARCVMRNSLCEVQYFPSVVEIPVFPFWKKVPEKFPGLPENSVLSKHFLIVS